MTARRILRRLERLPATGEAAGAAARLAFLEWVVSLEGETTPAAARAALTGLSAQPPASPAACAFLDCLAQAARPVRPLPARRAHRPMPS